MKKIANFPLLPISIVIVVMLLATAVLATACGSGTPTGDAVALQPGDLEPTAVAPAPTEETAVPPTPTSEPPPTDECLICHVDKDELIQTADPVEEVISENEGEG